MSVSVCGSVCTRVCLGSEGPRLGLFWVCVWVTSWLTAKSLGRHPPWTQAAPLDVRGPALGSPTNAFVADLRVFA